MYSCACSVANVQRVDTITPYFLSISAVMVNTSYMLFAAIPDGRRACPAIKIVFISSPLSQLKNYFENQLLFYLSFFHSSLMFYFFIYHLSMCLLYSHFSGYDNY